MIVYPTDTVYGLGCDPFNLEAVKRVFKVKGDRRKPLPVLASNIKSAERIAWISKMAEVLAGRFWPGPLTLIVPKKPALPEIVTCNLASVGMRIPKHTVAIPLINLSDGLLTGTSANKTGERPPQTAFEAAHQLGEEVDMILDGGRVPLGEPSTVIDLTLEKPKIVREGPVKLDEIEKALSSS